MNDAWVVVGDVRLPAGGYMAENGGGGARRIASASASTSAAAASATLHRSTPQPSQTAATTATVVAAPLVVVVDRDLITLNQPRPGVARARNEYIETPLRPPLPVGSKPPATIPNRNKSHEDSNANSLELRRALVHPGPPSTAPRPPPAAPASPESATTLSPPVGIHQLHLQTRRPIRNNTQACVTFKKEKPEAAAVGAGAAHGEEVRREKECDADAESIICGDCQRCKCEACRTPRPLPSTWVCGDKYLCSAETTLDYCSCMCCVKGLFYHYTKDYDLDSDDAVSCADQPCSCEPSNRCVRWSTVGALSLLLPCLLCYWPLKGCMKACEGCYARYHSRGCQCVQRRKVHEQQPKSNKRLLDTGHLLDG